LVPAPAVFWLALREVVGVPDAGGIDVGDELSAHTSGSARGLSGASPGGSAGALARDSMTLGSTPRRANAGEDELGKRA
jgi:hypothetical protein